jgi:DNA-directed RNA polymerase specialized sigma24 family protein
MSQNENAAESLVSELIPTIRQTVARVLCNSSQRRQEEEDIISDTFLKFFQRLDEVAADVPIRQQVRRFAKDTTIEWLRRKSVREPLFDAAKLGLLIQDDVEESGWADIEQLIRQSSHETREEQIAILALRYVEGEKVSESVRLNLAYASAWNAAAKGNCGPSLGSLTQSFPKHANVIGEIFDATGQAFHELSEQGRLTADLFTAEIWQRVWDWFDDNLPNVPGVNRWRKTLLIGVGATPNSNQREPDLSGSVQAVADRERRRLDDQLNEAEGAVRDHFFDDYRED